MTTHKFTVIAIIILVISLVALPLGASTQRSVYVDIREEITADTADRVIPIIYYARPGDVIYMTIDSPGGSVVAGDAIVNALNRSGATVIAVIDGQVASYAFNLTISSHFVIIKKLDELLIHAAYIQAGFFKIHGMLSTKLIHMKQKQLYKTYLTKGEMKYIFEDYCDLIMPQKTFEDRVDKPETPLRRIIHDRVHSVAVGINPDSQLSTRTRS